MLHADLGKTDPPSPSALNAKLHQWLWVLAVALSIGIGAARNVSESRSMDLGGPLGSWDAAIRTAVGDPFIASRLQSRIVQLPEKRPVLIICNKQKPQAEYVAQLVSYATWPRPAVIKITEDEKVSVKAEVIDERKYRAVVLYGTHSDQPLPDTKRLSPELEFVRCRE